MVWLCEYTPLPCLVPIVFCNANIQLYRQPCSPNFVQARDAILDADTALTGGVNKCDIWKGFAKRGLGSGAKYSATKRTGSTVLPAGC